jgi:predicted dithiol-disulfide oxidoreductase (DUF899 family)
MIERVAAQRRSLPAGGAPLENYQLEGDSGPTKLSELFSPGATVKAKPVSHTRIGNDKRDDCENGTDEQDQQNRSA